MSALEKEKGLKIAIEIFDVKARQLAKTRHPNIFVSGQEELFSDWFEDEIPYKIKKFGKNDHPDAVIEGIGFELKSKTGNGQIQFNSTIPSGRFKHRSGQEGECYYAITRYVKDRNFGQLHDFSIVYGDYFNHNYEWANSHINTQETEFGDYGDGVVRYRKMYSFPSPMKEVSGVSLILDERNAERYNNNLVFDHKISRIDKQTKEKYIFYVYRHKKIQE